KKIKGVSHETIYKWVWNEKHRHNNDDDDRLLYKELKHGKRRRKRGNYKDSRGTIKNRTPICERPNVVKDRERVGDIEVDLMMGKNHQSALLVVTDRATPRTILQKVKSKDAEVVSKAIIERLSRINNSWNKTITYDNGKEFALHEKVTEKTGAKAFF